MSINSKIKGKVAELEFAHWLKTNLGIAARRGQQFQGTPDSPDIVTDLERLHFEVKRVERLNIQEAMQQASNDAGDKIPIVAHRRNRTEWLITIKAKDLKEVCRNVGP